MSPRISAFLAEVDQEELRRQQAWLQLALQVRRPADRSARRLLRHLSPESLPGLFAVTGDALPEAQRVHWRAVHEMKAWLLQRRETRRQAGQEPIYEAEASGLIHLLDAVQDEAVDALGVQERYVFPTLHTRSFAAPRLTIQPATESELPLFLAA